MAMDLRDPNVWVSHLLENLPEEQRQELLHAYRETLSSLHDDDLLAE